MPCPHFGLYPKEYNRAVHGIYDPARYYGKPDTKLADVRIVDLPAWLMRRNYTPRAMLSCVSRNYWRYLHRFGTPRYASFPRWFFQLIICTSLFYKVSLYSHEKAHHRRYKYHW